MIMVFGLKAYREVLGVLTLICRLCGSPAMQRLEQITTKCTLMSVPLFAVTARYDLECGLCAKRSRMERAEAMRLLAADHGS